MIAAEARDHADGNSVAEAEGVADCHGPLAGSQPSITSRTGTRVVSVTSGASKARSSAGSPWISRAATRVPSSYWIAKLIAPAITRAVGQHLTILPHHHAAAHTASRTAILAALSGGSGADTTLTTEGLMRAASSAKSGSPLGGADAIVTAASADMSAGTCSGAASGSRLDRAAGQHECQPHRGPLTQTSAEQYQK